MLTAGEIPASLGQLTNLTQLDLQGNQFSGKRRSDVMSTSLWLSPCYPLLCLLCDFVPFVQFRVSAAFMLYTRCGNMTGEIPMSLSLLTNLTALDLESNHLSGKKQ